MRETPSTQRYYVPGRLMQSFSAQDPAIPPYSSNISPALTNFADEVCATVARLFVYVGVLMLFGILGLHGWERLRADLAAGPAPAPGCSVADRSFPAFAPSPQNASDKSERSDSYTILRHPLGGRKDIFRWPGTGEKPIAGLEIAGAELNRGGRASASAPADWLTDAANPRLRGAF
jgi:hypothetical protein